VVVATFRDDGSVEVANVPNYRTDDCALEGAPRGAKFWITGVGAFPKHTVKLWDLATSGKIEEAIAPLSLDAADANGGKLGNNLVRPPRLELTGAELTEATAIIEKALATAPNL
jgi:1-pyrroline-4-hydroxy-2-carboxylate deaminase